MISIGMQEPHGFSMMVSGVGNILHMPLTQLKIKGRPSTTNPRWQSKIHSDRPFSPWVYEHTQRPFCGVTGFWHVFGVPRRKVPFTKRFGNLGKTHTLWLEFNRCLAVL
uniref:Uncharacterized protein n=1 Tax=Clytia hemisphaerica TaxID=252671 RepID=A0A7M5XN26_9CNID